MKPILAWSLSGAGGILLGHLLTIRLQGDFWLGSILIVASAVALYGTIQFPEHFFRSPLLSGSNSHDTQIDWQPARRNAGEFASLPANKGYDWMRLRDKLREEGVRPLIKHRKFRPIDCALNA